MKGEVVTCLAGDKIKSEFHPVALPQRCVTCQAAIENQSLMQYLVFIFIIKSNHDINKDYTLI